MIHTEDLHVERFLTKRMLRYCKEVGMTYYESVQAMHVPASERTKYENDWLEA